MQPTRTFDYGHTRQKQSSLIYVRYLGIDAATTHILRARALIDKYR